MNSPDGEPWCRFSAGSLSCTAGPACENPHHREETTEDYWMQSNDFPRDRFQRPQVILPGDDKPTALTRVTTLAKATDDQYNLIGWKARQALWGCAQKRSLIDRAATISSPDDKKALDELVEQGCTIAGSASASHDGSSLHALTEGVDKKNAALVVPDHWRDHITRYKTLVAAYGFEWDWIEVPLVTPSVFAAGTADRIARWRGKRVVVDLKTGKTLDFSKVAIAQQMAIYSRAKYRWDGKQCVPAPEMDQDEAIVIWLPAYSDEAKVYSVDIAAGWELVQTSVDVREIRKSKGRDLFVEIAPEPAKPEPAKPEPVQAEIEIESDRLDEVTQRVRKIVSAGYAADLSARWAADVPTLKQGGLTPEQLELVDGWCDVVERQHEMPF